MVFLVDRSVVWSGCVSWFSLDYVLYYAKYLKKITLWPCTHTEYLCSVRFSSHSHFHWLLHWHRCLDCLASLQLSSFFVFSLFVCFNLLDSFGRFSLLRCCVWLYFFFFIFSSRRFGFIFFSCEVCVLVSISLY